MHFLYLDESGDTGCNLDDEQQPIFVLAGLSVADKKWNNTKEALDKLIGKYFDADLPDDFELHSHELLSPNGDGPFKGHELSGRLELATTRPGRLVSRGGAKRTPFTRHGRTLDFPS